MFRDWFLCTAFQNEPHGSMISREPELRQIWPLGVKIAMENDVFDLSFEIFSCNFHPFFLEMLSITFICHCIRCSFILKILIIEYIETCGETKSNEALSELF